MSDQAVRDELSPRIVGTELEYGVAVQFEEDGELTSLSLTTPDLHEAVPEAYQGFGQFLRNGARFYMDVGSHSEYATPEDDSIEGVVANEMAGDQIVADTMHAVAKNLGAAAITVNRRVVDMNGGAWGYHENYSCSRDMFQSEAVRNLLTLHLATRNLYAGAGALNRAGQFMLAQKAQILTHSVVYGTTGGTKPLISTRDEPHADKDRMGRICVVGGDPSMSPWSTRMKLGATWLVLEAAERKYIPEELMPERESSHKIAKLVAGDLTLRQTVQLTGIRDITPLEVQFNLLAAVQQMAEDIDIGPEKSEIVSEWERALTELEAKGIDGLLDRADWPMRLRILERHRTNGRYDHDTDYRWDALKESGYGVRLRQKLWQPWMPDEALVQSRTVTAPPTTRAAVRGRFIEFVRAQPEREQEGYSVDWSNLGAPASRRGRTFFLKDPFAVADQDVDAFLLRAAAEAEAA